MGNQRIQLLTRPAYLTDLARRAAGAGPGDRLVVATMSFDPADPAVGELLGAWQAAAQRGADVSFMVDAYAYLIYGGTRPGPLFWHRELPRRLGRPFQAIHEALEGLAAAGVKVTVLNRPQRLFTLPVAGRSHIKFAYVNGRVYIGGCNLDWHTKVDVMAAWDDAPTAAWLRGFAGKMAETGNAGAAAGGHDLECRISATETLLVDAGRRGQSLIFDSAMAMIDAARESVFIACQFFPNDVTGQHLAAAQQRGVKVEILYNHASQQSFPHNLLHHYVAARERRRLPASFFVQGLRRQQPMLHAKLIATERESIMGSHNFVSAGVRLGTAEIALMSIDPALGRRARQNLLDQINN
ncbi:MAG: hypothetical protein NVSMB39_2950 [Candidatus Saccharimonadales bacterium]